MKPEITLKELLDEVRACTLCEGLPLGPRPVLRAQASARVLIIGQAPGTRVHETGVPWNDPSGDRLRQWMAVDRDTFYDESRIAIVPMGLCYPGKGKSGDLPPRKECAPHWHGPVFEHLPNIELTLLVGQYAQRYYLGKMYPSVTEAVRRFQEVPAPFFPLVHPSPRNKLWLKRNSWFDEEVVPELRSRIRKLLSSKGAGRHSDDT